MGKFAEFNNKVNRFYNNYARYISGGFAAYFYANATVDLFGLNSPGDAAFSAAFGTAFLYMALKQSKRV